jgi:hypothetical protein
MKYNDDIPLDNYLLRLFDLVDRVYLSNFQIFSLSIYQQTTYEKMETIYLILEKAILWSGDTESLQDFRSWTLSRTNEVDGYPATELMSSLLEYDSKLRCITQREECLLEQVQVLAGKENTPLEKKNYRSSNDG